VSSPRLAPSQSVTVLLYRDVPSTAPLESWRLGAWSDTTGWPHVGDVLSAAVVHGAQLAQPQTIWASQSGDFQNNRPDSWVAGAKSVQDSNALNFTLASGYCRAHYMADGRKAADRGNGYRAMVHFFQGRGADAKRLLG
jgi:hypothetical protein